MVSQIERVMDRRQVEALIKSDPIWVIFQRKIKVEMPGGGWRYGDPTPVKKQEVTLIPFKRRMSEFLINTELGDVPDLPFVLLGRYTLDIQPKDIFVHDGDTFEVQTIDPLNRDVRTAAHVDYFGGNING